LIFLLGVVVIVAIHEGGQLRSHGESLLADRYPKTIHANTMIDRVNKLSQAMGKVLLADDVNQTLRHRGTVAAIHELVDEEFAWLQQHEGSAAGKRLLDAI